MLQAIQHQHTHPGIRSVRDYHNYMLLLESITDLLDARRRAGHRTTLHKIRAHTNIWGNDLAEAAAKLAVRSFDTLSPNNKLRVDIREVAPRQQHWVMYTATPPSLGISPATPHIYATTPRAWWTILGD